MVEKVEQKWIKLLGVMVHTINPSNWVAEAREFLSSRPAWSTYRVPRQSALHRETLSQEKLKKKNAQKLFSALHKCSMA